MHITKKSHGCLAMCSNPKDKSLRMGCCIAFVSPHYKRFCSLSSFNSNGHWISTMDRVGEVRIHRLASDDSRESSPSLEHLKMSHEFDRVIWNTSIVISKATSENERVLFTTSLHTLIFYLSTLKEKKEQSRICTSVLHLWTSVYPYISKYECVCTRVCAHAQVCVPAEYPGIPEFTYTEPSFWVSRPQERDGLHSHAWPDAIRSILSHSSSLWGFLAFTAGGEDVPRRWVCEKLAFNIKIMNRL